MEKEREKKGAPSARKARLVDAAVSVLVTAVLTTAALFSLSWWFGNGRDERSSQRIPDEANRRAAAAAAAAVRASIGEHFLKMRGTASSLAGSWPRFRGADGTNVAAGGPPLAMAWPPSGPQVLWTTQLGEGHGGPAVWNGRVYLLDYDEALESDALRCLSLDDGEEIWRRWYRTGAKRNHGISRTIPSVADGFVVTVGPKCHAMCVDAASGRLLWGMDLVRDYGAQEPLWFAAQNPLIDEGRAILAPAGRALLVAVDCASGRVLWETPNPMGWKMSHSSVVPMEFGGRRMFVYSALGGIAGVAADGPDAGKILWTNDQWAPSVLAPTPVVLPEGRIFVTAGYGYGSAMVELTAAGGGFTARLARRWDRSEFASEQQTPIFYEGRLITVMPKDAGDLRQEVVAMTPDGRTVFSSGKDMRFGLGPFLVADGKLLVLNDDGLLTMAQVDGSSFKVLSRARVIDGRDAWAPMAVAAGRLLLRDATRLLCLDLGRGA